MEHRPAYYTYDPEADAWYFARGDRSPPPYKTQRHVEAIIDVASDGTLAGIELLSLEPIRQPRSSTIPDETVEAMIKAAIDAAVAQPIKVTGTTEEVARQSRRNIVTATVDWPVVMRAALAVFQAREGGE